MVTYYVKWRFQTGYWFQSFFFQNESRASANRGSAARTKEDARTAEDRRGIMLGPAQSERRYSRAPVLQARRYTLQKIILYYWKHSALQM